MFRLGSRKKKADDADAVEGQPPALEWRGHSILLPDGSLTRPGVPPLIESRRYAAIDRLARKLVGDVAGLRVADMGCFEGAFSLGFAQAGANVLGIEAREANMAKLRVLDEAFALPNLRFELGDVKDFTLERYGRFDLVLCLGVLYHLDNPVEWLAQVAQMTDAIVVDTAYAPSEDEFAGHQFEERLAPLTSVAVGKTSYEGRWFHEFPEDDDPAPKILASFSNASSFWLTKPALQLALVRAGFAGVVEYADAWTVAGMGGDQGTRVIFGAWR